MNALVLIFLLAATVRQTDAKSGVSSVTIHAHDELCANATNANLDAVSVLTLLPPSTSTNVGPTKVPFFALFRKLGVLLVLNATGDDDEVLPMAVDVQMNAETGSSTNLKSIKLNRVGTSAAFASCASGPVWDFDEPFDVGAIATFTVKVFEDVNKLVDLPKGDLPHHAAEIQAPFPVLAQTKLNFMPNTDGTIIVVDSIFVSSGEYLPNGSCQTTPRTDRPLFVRTASHGLFDCKMTAPTKCTALPLPVSVSSNINNSDPSSYFSRSIDGTKGDMIFPDSKGFFLAQKAVGTVFYSSRPECASMLPLNWTIGGSIFKVSPSDLLVVADGNDGPELVSPGAAHLSLSKNVTNVLDNNGTLTLPPPPTWTTVSTDESAWPTFASVYFDAQARLRRLITIVGNDAKIGGNPIIVDSRNASASGQLMRTLTTDRGRTVVFDCNNDGFFDVLLLGNGVLSGDAAILVSTEGATRKIGSFQLLNLSSGQFQSAYALDVNGDGMPDLLTTPANVAKPAVFLNTGVRGAAKCSFSPVPRDLHTMHIDSVVATVSDVVGKSAPEWIGTSNGGEVREIDLDATGFITARLNGPSYASIRVTLPRAPMGKALFSHIYLDAANHRDDQVVVPVPRSQRFDLETFVFPAMRGVQSRQYCSVAWRDIASNNHLLNVYYSQWNDSVLASPLQTMPNLPPALPNLTVGTNVTLIGIVSFPESAFFQNDLFDLTISSSCFDQAGQTNRTAISAAAVAKELKRERTVAKTWNSEVRVCDFVLTIGYTAAQQGCDMPRVFPRKFPIVGIAQPTASTISFNSPTGGNMGMADEEIREWHYAVGVIAGLLLLAAIGVIIWAVVTRGSAPASAAKAKLRRGDKATNAEPSGTPMSVNPTSEYGAFPPEKAAYGDSQFSNLA